MAELLLTALEAIYEAAAYPDKWPTALQLIAECFGDVGSVLIWQSNDGAFGTIASEALEQAQLDYVQNGWAPHDIYAVRSVERGYMFSGEPFSHRHLCSDDETDTLPFFTTFRARHGLGFIGCVAVSPSPEIGVALSIQRGRSKADFSDAELQTVALIGRHVERSLRLSLRLLDAEVAKIGLGEALAQLGVGTFVLDSAAQIIFSNAAANELLGDHLEIAHGRLSVGYGDERRRNDNAILKTVSGNSIDTSYQKPIVVHRSSSSRPLVIYLIPIAPPAHLAEAFLRRARAILLVIEPKINEPADPTILRDVFGLTLGESRVAALVGAGFAPKETAQRLNIADETARNVLKRVFAKIGVSRQSELVALLAGLTLR